MFPSRLSQWAAAVLAAAGLTMFLAFSAPTPAAAQYYDEDVREELREGDYEDLEYEPGEGLHEEEWYDPSDWFDVSPGISYEDDDTYWYDDNYYSDDYYDYDEYGYDDDYFYDRRTWYDEDYYTDDWWDASDFYDWYD